MFLIIVLTSAVVTTHKVFLLFLLRFIDHFSFQFQSKNNTDWLSKFGDIPMRQSIYVVDPDLCVLTNT